MRRFVTVANIVGNINPIYILTTYIMTVVFNIIVCVDGRQKQNVGSCMQDSLPKHFIMYLICSLRATSSPYLIINELKNLYIT
jgi:hypothetical protein